MIFETLSSISAKLGTGEIDSPGLTKSVFADIDALNPRIGCYTDLLHDSAMQEAAASDERRSNGQVKGPLDGVPIAIKDLIDTTPARCSAGLEHLKNYKPATDATVVRRLREAGAVILGVTASDPGAFSTATPQVINPLAPERTAGGSSGGSGAAVASSLAFGAIGTDTGGSVRIPAACCSICGFKPTWGRVDATGVRPLAPSLDHIGPLARSVTDLQILQSIIDPSFDNRVNWSASRETTLGVPSFYFSDAEPDIQAQFLSVYRALEAKGIRLQEIELPEPDEVMEFHMVNLPKEAAEYHLENFPERWRGYPDVARETIGIGRAITSQELEKAELRRVKTRCRVQDVLEQVDALIMPTMPIRLPLREVETYQLNGSSLNKLEATIRYTSLFNQTGHPAISMPAAKFDDGLGFSIQIVGSSNSDSDLVALARYLEGVLTIDIAYDELLGNSLNRAVFK